MPARQRACDCRLCQGQPQPVFVADIHEVRVTLGWPVHVTLNGSAET